MTGIGASPFVPKSSDLYRTWEVLTAGPLHPWPSCAASSSEPQVRTFQARYHKVGDPRYPYAMTTYRLTEHHSGGTPTRSVPTTAELQPEGFAEIPTELAEELGIRNLDWVVLSTARGEIETKALVTERLRPFVIDGQRVYQIGMPWHYGWKGYATGDIANVLSSVVGDPNTSMHEGKAFTCNLRKGRLPKPFQRDHR